MTTHGARSVLREGLRGLGLTALVGTGVIAIAALMSVVGVLVIR